LTVFTHPLSYAGNIDWGLALLRKKGAISPFFPLCRLRNSATAVFIHSFHAEAYPALTINFKYLDLDDITFGQLVGYIIDTLFRNLGNMDQTVLAL